VGSTEWAEDFASWISRHAVAYLNTDVSASGSRWNVAGSPSLAHLIKRSALDVPHPTIEGKTLWDARTDEGPFTGDGTANMTVDAEVMSAYFTAKKEMQASDTSVNPLGSGSDYTVFLQRLGVSCHFFLVIALFMLMSQVASLDEGFGGTLTDAVYHYHSVYDSQRFQELYADPGFHRHVR
jgi:N-acetylated-alpha-linked acidic dipeptidase